jgi:hypothetical protein
VTIKITSTKLAPAAGEVDFADYALIDEFRWSLDDGTDELVPGDALEAHVTVKNLEIGGADAGEVNLDQGSLIVAKSAAPGGRSCDLRFSILYLRLLGCGIR